MSMPVDGIISGLINRLHDADPAVRRNAAGCLRLHGARASCAVHELAQLLEDEDVGVRVEARRALSRLRDSAA
ncbi:MAG: HEAT repeat domain-containing protein [Thermoguttaceae bacterium]